ncbi:MAG TPA: hypothetical protein VGM48_20145, partial [Puia sp.]
MKKIILLSLMTGAVLSSRATVRLPSVLSPGMVLQRESTVKFWGWCEPGEKVYVTGSWGQGKDSVPVTSDPVLGTRDSVIGTRDGKWEVHLSTPVAGGPYTVTIKGSNTIV